MKNKKIRLGRIILTLAILMTVLICTGINVSAAKKQKITAKTTTLMVGNTTTLTYKNAPKNLKKSKVKWTITSGKKYAKIKVAKNKKTATITGLKAGKVTVQLKYKSKKVGIVKLAIKTKTTTKDTANSTDDKKTTEDKDRKTEKVLPKQPTTEATTAQATTEATKADYVAKYSYEVYPVHPEYTVYNQGEYYYYLKTNNPNAKTILKSDNSQGVGYAYLVSSTKVADIGYGKNTTTGGYIFSIKDPVADANGNFNLDVYEFDKDGLATAMKNTTNLKVALDDSSIRAKAFTFSVKVSDYDTAYNALLKKITDEVAAGWKENTPEKVENSLEPSGYRTISTFERQMDYAQSVAKQYIGDAYVVNSKDIATAYTTKSMSTVLNGSGMSCVFGSEYLCKIAKGLGYTDVGVGKATVNNEVGGHADVWGKVDGVVYEVESGYTGKAYTKAQIDDMQFNPANIDATTLVTKSN